MTLARLASSFDVTVGDTPLRIDAQKVVFFGHSQGATEGSLMLPFSSVYKGAVLSGNGASLRQSLMHKKKPADIRAARQLIDEIYIDDKVKDYIVDLIFATREPQKYKAPVKELILYGASPRATINLTLAAKANAFLQGRGYVVPQDVKDLAMDVLRHRIVVTYEAEAENKTSEHVVRSILEHVPVP